MFSICSSSITSKYENSLVIGISVFSWPHRQQSHSLSAKGQTNSLKISRACLSLISNATESDSRDVGHSGYVERQARKKEKQNQSSPDMFKHLSEIENDEVPDLCQRSRWNYALVSFFFSFAQSEVTQIRIFKGRWGKELPVSQIIIGYTFLIWVIFALM